jgi:hypothetical protein
MVKELQTLSLEWKEFVSLVWENVEFAILEIQ